MNLTTVHSQHLITALHALYHPADFLPKDSQDLCCGIRLQDPGSRRWNLAIFKVKICSESELNFEPITFLLWACGYVACVLNFVQILLRTFMAVLTAVRTYVFISNNIHIVVSDEDLHDLHIVLIQSINQTRE